MPTFTLTAAIGPENADIGYANIDFLGTQTGTTGASSSLNFFNVMAYNYAWSSTAPPTSNAPADGIAYDISLLTQPQAPATKPLVPASQILYGVPFYGVEWTWTGTGQKPSSSSSLSTLLNEPSGSWTFENNPSYQNTPPYNVISPLLASSEVLHDSTNETAWAYDNSTGALYTYDDATTLNTKASLARTLGGMMAWDLTQDSATGTLLCSAEQYMANSSKSICSAPPATSEVTLGSNVAGASFTVSGSDCLAGPSTRRFPSCGTGRTVVR